MTAAHRVVSTLAVARQVVEIKFEEADTADSVCGSFAAGSPGGQILPRN